MSKLWLFIDTVITSPFYLIGYTAGAITATVVHGFRSYGVNYRNAKKGLL